MSDKEKPRSKRNDPPQRLYRDDPLLIEAMQALIATPGRRWLRDKGGFEPMHMDCRTVTARRYTGLVHAVSDAVKPRPSGDFA